MKLMNILIEIIERSGFHLLSLFLGAYLWFILALSDQAITDQTAQIVGDNAYLNLTVNDKPLLTDAQKEQVKRTDSVTIKLGNETLVIQSGARAALKGYYES